MATSCGFKSRLRHHKNQLVCRLVFSCPPKGHEKYHFSIVQGAWQQEIAGLRVFIESHFIFFRNGISLRSNDIGTGTYRHIHRNLRKH